MQEIAAFTEMLQAQEIQLQAQETQLQAQETQLQAQGAQQQTQVVQLQGQLWTQAISYGTLQCNLKLLETLCMLHLRC